MIRKNIYHRDLKPDNILFLDRTQLKVCIADLGLACRSTDARELLFKCGTPGYVAPEQLKGLGIGPKSDIFSLGCLFYNIVTGKMIFSGPDRSQVLFKNMYLDTSKIIEQTCQHLSEECRDLLKKMTLNNPETRPSPEECLQHPWFAKDRA